MACKQPRAAKTQPKKSFTAFPVGHVAIRFRAALVTQHRDEPGLGPVRSRESREDDQGGVIHLWANYAGVPSLHVEPQPKHE